MDSGVTYHKIKHDFETGFKWSKWQFMYVLSLYKHIIVYEYSDELSIVWMNSRKLGDQNLLN